MTCDPNEGGARTTTQWFNTVVLPAADARGERRAGRQRGARTSSAGPASTGPIVSLFKNFALRAASSCSCGWRAFNVFNQERFGQPGNTLGAATFGAITAADDGRIVQLGIKYTF